MNEININRIKFITLINIVESLVKKEKYSQAISLVKQVSKFAVNYETGYYYSLRLEKILKKIARKTIINIKKEKKEKKVNSQKRQVLHVVTEIHYTGGHTRLLNNWVKNDTDSDHSIVSTQMEEEKLNLVLDFFKLDLIRVYSLRGELTEKVISLSSISLDYDVVILHIHQYDIIPIMAYSLKEFDQKRIFFMNHADHTFWLGVTISDYFIYIRKNIMSLDRKRRGIAKKQQLYLPIPIKEQKDRLIKSSNLREDLDIKKDDIVLISIATAFKFKPYKGIDFFEDLSKLLEKDKKLILILIGVNGHEVFVNKHKRILCLGEQNDIDKFLSLSNVYIENFPLGSSTSVLNAMNNKIPVQLMHSPQDTLKILQEEDGFLYPSDYEEWEKKILKLIKSKEEQEKVLNNQNKMLVRDHYSKGWKNKLDIIYSAKKTTNEFKEELFFNTKTEHFFYVYKNNVNPINYRTIIKLFSPINFYLNYYIIKLIGFEFFSRKIFR